MLLRVSGCAVCSSRCVIFPIASLAEKPYISSAPRIPINDPVLMIAHDDCIVGQIEESCLFRQASLRLFLFGDIASNFRNAENFPSRTLDRRNRQRNID